MRNLVEISFLVASSCAIGQPLSPYVQNFVKVNSGTVVLEHVRVVDGTGASAKEDQTIVISGGKIKSVGAATNFSPLPGSQVLDLKGSTVIPGLVGMHEHMFYPLGWGLFGEMAVSFPKLYLAGGVTTIRTTGAIEPYTDLELKKRIDAGEVPGPKMHVTGPYLEGKGSWSMQMHGLDGPDDAIRDVNFWLDEGVEGFKAYTDITPQELRAAIEAAHKRGAKVTGHLCSVGFREAAALGIDNLEHGLIIDTEFFPEKKPGLCPETPHGLEFLSKLDIESGPVHELILDLVRHHVAITSTLAVFEMGLPGRPPIQQRVLDALAPQTRADFLAAKVDVTDLKALRQRYGEQPTPYPAVFKKEMEFERAFVKAGGLLMAGVDPTGMGGVLPGYGDQREVELLVEAGFSPVEAIHIATENGAEYLGQAAHIGTIEPGKDANLVVVKGDPSSKIEDIENVDTVFKDGIGYDPAKLSESVRGMVGIR